MKSFSQAGMSLLEIMIGIGIMSAGGMFMANMIQNMNKSQNHLRFSLARAEIRADIANYIMTQNASCSCGIKDMLFDPAALPATLAMTSIDLMGDPINCTNPLRSLVKPNMVNENAKITALNLVIKNGASPIFTGEIHVDLDNLAPVGTSIKRKIIIPMDINTTDSGANQKIVGCGAPAGLGDVDMDPVAGTAGDSRVPLNGGFAWPLTKITASAKGIIVNYTLGSTGQDREPRHCTATGPSGSTSFGSYSTGDARQKMVSGTFFLRLAGSNPPYNLNFSCMNDGSVGNLEVMAVFY